MKLDIKNYFYICSNNKKTNINHERLLNYVKQLEKNIQYVLNNPTSEISLTVI